MSSLSDQSKKLAARLQAIPREIVLQVRPVIMATANELAATMRALAKSSRDTGALIDSIAVTAPGQSTPAYAAGGGKRTAGENQALVTVGNPEVRHAHLVEFGTVKTEAQPFFLPAERLTREKGRRRIARAIGKAIKDAATGGTDA